mgnify:CR=1 FL=1
MKLKDLIKVAAPIAIGTFAPGLMPGMNPILARGLASGVGSLVMGGKPKDALLAGALGAGIGAMFPGQQAGAEQLSESGAKLPIGSSGKVSVDQMAKKAVQDTIRGGAGTGAANVVAPVAADTMSAKLLEGIGIDSDNLLFKVLNTKLGEGVAAGLVAQLLAGDDDEEVVGEFERRPFGAGGPGGKLGDINYAEGGEAMKQNRQPTIMDMINNFKTIQTPFGSGVTGEQRLELLKRLGMVQTAANGGEMSFPRRNGGIDPAEGSGKKDDVPAMLMAGEFVMTRDAVKGMGDGNLRKGIDRMYGMMDNLERMA